MSGTAIDTNVLLYALNADAPEHRAARAFLDQRRDDPDTMLSELVLVELYVLLRNPSVVRRPLDGAEAAAIVGGFRRHPRWRLVDHAPEVMDNVWATVAAPGSARGRIFDVRFALGVRRHGATCLATRNVRHFDGLGFERVFNPLAD